MAVDYFLKIDQIEGESKDSKHANELQLLSWSWGESNSGSAGNQTSGKTNDESRRDHVICSRVCADLCFDGAWAVRFDRNFGR